MRKIITSHQFPPIPDRRFDWMAYYEGQEETGAYGHGATEQEAVDDFIANYQDDEDDRLAGRLTTSPSEAG